jgi:hypothetical protein
MKAISSVLVRFQREGVEISVSYFHDGVESASPGSKGRVVSAARAASKALEAALEYLDKAEPGEVKWGGFSTSTVESTDTVLVDRRGADAKAS